MKSCIYAGSFDCFHKGHSNIVNRALKMFDRVIILVANNPAKKYTFTIDERIAIINSTIPHNDTSESNSIEVDVLPNNQLVSDYARSKGISTILKGIRNISDNEYERMLHEVTVAQENGVDTCVLFSNPTDAKLSSSAAKELIKYNGDVRDYVSLFAKQQLEIKINQQYIIGVTGTIGCGKSYITQLLLDAYVDQTQIKVTHIDMDMIAYDLTYSNKYNWQNNNEVMEMRTEVQRMLGYKDPHSFPTIVKSKLQEAVFNDKHFNSDLQNLYKPVMIREIRRQISGKTGMIILNGALLIDCNMQYLCNNNVIVVDTSTEELHNRLFERYKDVKDVVKRMDSQLSNNSKIGNLQNSIVNDNYGKMVIIKNEKGNPIYDLQNRDAKQLELLSILRSEGFFDAIGFNI